MPAADGLAEDVPAICSVSMLGRHFCGCCLLRGRAKRHVVEGGGRGFFGRGRATMARRHGELMLQRGSAHMAQG